MILAIKWAREQKVPFLGICLGFQLAVIEFARNVCGIKGTINECSVAGINTTNVFTVAMTEATSTEFDADTTGPVIIFMPEISKTHMGGTMRLGLRPTVFEESSKGWSRLRKLYGGADKIWERHRHRYEVNPALIEKITDSGLSFTGKDEKGERMQVLELKGTYRGILPGISAAVLRLLGRSPILCWPASPSRILHSTSQPVTGLPWIRRSCFRAPSS